MRGADRMTTIAYHILLTFCGNGAGSNEISLMYHNLSIQSVSNYSNFTVVISYTIIGLACVHVCYLNSSALKSPPHLINCRCAMVVTRGNLDDHIKGECPLRQYSCPDCSKSGTYHYIIEEHQEQCPEATIPCPNGCGYVPITRRLEANHCRVCPNQVHVHVCVLHKLLHIRAHHII